MRLCTSGRLQHGSSLESRARCRAHCRRHPHRLRISANAETPTKTPDVARQQTKQLPVSPSAALLEPQLEVDILDATWLHLQQQDRRPRQKPRSKPQDATSIRTNRTSDSQRTDSVQETRPFEFLTACIERSRTDLVMAYFSLYPKDRSLFHSVLQSLLRSRHYGVVCDLVDRQLQMGVSPDPYIYNSQISAFGKLGRMEEARDVFDEAVASGNDSIYVYNTLLDAYARTGDVDRAEEIWEAVRAADLRPDAVSYVGMLRAYGNRDRFADVQRVFDEMMSNTFLKPMPHAYTALFNAARKSSVDIDAGWLMSVLDGLHAAGIGTNKHILSAFLNAAARTSLNSEQIERIFAEVESLRKTSTPDNSLYTTLLQFCIARKIPERAMDIWSFIQSGDIAPNGHVYASLLKACAVMNDNRRQKFAFGISEKLRSDWKTRSRSGLEESSMTAAFNSLMHYYSSVRQPEASMEIYRFMLHHGPQPDLITYNSVLSASIRSEGDGRVQSVLKHMRSSGCRMDPTTYGILLNGCANTRDVNRAVALMMSMEEAGMKPTVECYTALMDTCIKEGSNENLALAFETFKRMKKAKIKPTAVTYGCLLMAHRHQDDVEGAFRLYREACRSGISPSDECHNVLIDMCTEAGRLDDALALIKVLVRKHGDIAEDTMNSIIRALSTDYLPRSLVLMRMMDNRSIVSSPETFHCLILACCRESETQTAFGLYREMIQRRLPVRRDVGSALIEALSQAGEAMAALRVTNYMFEKAGLPLIDPATINKRTRRDPYPRAFNRKDRVMMTALPHVISLGWLIVALIRRHQLKMGIYLFRQIALIDPSGMMYLAKKLKQVFEMLIEMGCEEERVDMAVEVFLEWRRATRRDKGQPMEHRAKSPRMSLASLAFLLATCKRTPGYEGYMQRICDEMRVHDVKNGSNPPPKDDSE